MAEQENGDGKLKAEQGPTCPKCGANLINYRGHLFEMPIGVAHVTWCDNQECRCLLGIQIIAPSPQPQKAAPRILPGSALPFNPTRKM